jgi:hypothetical protein
VLRAVGSTIYVGSGAAIHFCLVVTAFGYEAVSIATEASGRDDEFFGTSNSADGRPNHLLSAFATWQLLAVMIYVAPLPARAAARRFPHVAPLKVVGSAASLAPQPLFIAAASLLVTVALRPASYIGLAAVEMITLVALVILMDINGTGVRGERGGGGIAAKRREGAYAARGDEGRVSGWKGYKERSAAGEPVVSSPARASWTTHAAGTTAARRRRKRA